jgi:CheY-like chemotaxis protein
MPSIVREQDSLLKRMEKIRILVVDGSTKAGELIKEILQQLGFSNVLLANDGFQGIQMTREVHVDIIITDWELLVCKHAPPSNDQEEEEKEPEILPVSGTLFVKRLRFSPTSPNPFVPVVMLLRTATVRDIISARDSGVDEIIIKPFGVDEFCQKIINVIDSPRIFITADTYKGPCRRRVAMPLPEGIMEERRKREIRLIRHDEGGKYYGKQ